jgi:hypothetical protein
MKDTTSHCSMQQNYQELFGELHRSLRPNDELPTSGRPNLLGRSLFGHPDCLERKNERHWVDNLPYKLAG